MKNENGIYRKYLIPKCPMCGKESTFAFHLKCKRKSSESKFQHETLWINLLTGLIECEGCDYKKDISNIENLCTCGAIFSGGQLWEGMFTEISIVEDFAWFKLLKISKGSITPRFIRWAFLFPEYHNGSYKVKDGSGYRLFPSIDSANDFIRRKM